MPHSTEDRIADRTTWRKLAIVIGTLVSITVLIAGWVTFLSHSIEGKI